MINNDKIVAAMNGEPMEDPKIFKKFITEDIEFEQLEGSQTTH